MESVKDDDDSLYNYDREAQEDAYNGSIDNSKRIKLNSRMPDMLNEQSETTNAVAQSFSLQRLNLEDGVIGPTQGDREYQETMQTPTNANNARRSDPQTADMA